jgi:hypothetical protein
VYDEPLTQVVLEDEAAAPRAKPTGPSARVRKKARQKGKELTTDKAAEAAELPVKDDYMAKIAKYVPAEVVSISVLGFATFEPAGRQVWVGLVLGAVVNVLYLAGTAITLKAASRPRWYFYLLSIGAFVAWATATIGEVRNKFGLEGKDNDPEAAFILLAAAFLLPLLDTLANNIELKFAPAAGG